MNIVNPRAPTGRSTGLPHLPVSGKTLDTSVTTLVRTTKDLPDIAPGYGLWREAFDRGKAGIFTLPVAKIIDGIEQGLSGSKKAGESARN